jgi:hypothetical protein
MTEHSNAVEVLPASDRPDGRGDVPQAVRSPDIAPSGLFRTNDPVEVIEKATVVANALAGVIDSRRLFTPIQGRNHVNVEGWLTAGAMLGITPFTEWTRPLADRETAAVSGWEARVIVRTADGRTIGAAEAMCDRSEERGPWKKASDQAIRSMAQTRATSKALASVLRFIVAMTGYSTTPAEEVEPDLVSPVSADERYGADRPDLPDERVAPLGARIIQLDMPLGELRALFGDAGADAPKNRSKASVAKALRRMTPDMAEALEVELDKLEAPAPGTGEADAMADVERTEVGDR